MPKLNIGALPAESNAQRRALAAIGESDVADMEAWVKTWRATGYAPKPGSKTPEEVSAADARKIILNTGIEWAPAEAAYLYRGEALAPQVVKAAVDAATSQGNADIGVLVGRATSGTIEAGELYSSMQLATKRIYMASGSMAYGGPQNMSPARWERVSAALLERWGGRPQAAAQRGFPGLRAIIEAASKGGYDNDLNQLGSDLVNFANGGRIVYENERQIANREIGNTLVIRLLASGVNHCPNCLEIAARGARPNDGSDPVGSDYCQDACYCTEIYVRDESIPLAPAVEVEIEKAKQKAADAELVKAGRMKEG